MIPQFRPPAGWLGSTRSFGRVARTERDGHSEIRADRFVSTPTIPPASGNRPSTKKLRCGAPAAGDKLAD